MSVPFKPGDRIRLKANHAIEAVVDGLAVADRFCFWLDGSRVTHTTNRPEEWERVPKPMPKLEPGMVVEINEYLWDALEDTRGVKYWDARLEEVKRVGRVEWIWERDDA